MGMFQSENGYIEKYFTVGDKVIVELLIDELNGMCLIYDVTEDEILHQKYEPRNEFEVNITLPLMKCVGEDENTLVFTTNALALLTKKILRLKYGNEIPISMHSMGYEAVDKLIANRGNTNKAKNKNKDGATLNDVILDDDTKRSILRVINFVAKKPLYEAIGAKLSRGILLWGNPGVGKTRIGQVIAQETGYNIVIRSASSLLGQYVGSSAKNVRDLFAEQKQKGGNSIIFLDEIDAVKAKYPDAYAKMQPEAHKLVKKMSLAERLTRINKPIYGITAGDILPSSWGEYYQVYVKLHDKYPNVLSQVSRAFSRWEKRELTDAIWADVKGLFSEEEKKKLREIVLLDYYEQKKFSFIFEGEITRLEKSYIASYYFKQKREKEFISVYEKYASHLKEFALPYFKLKWTNISPKSDPLEDKFLRDMLISRDIDPAESLKLALSDSHITLPRIINLLTVLSDHSLLGSGNVQEVHKLFSKILDADMSLSTCADMLCKLPPLCGLDVKLSDFKIRTIGKDADKYINRLEKSAYSSLINAFKEKKMEKRLGI